MPLSRQFARTIPAFTLFFLFWLNCTTAQTTVQWTDPIDIVGDSGQGTASPRIALYPDGSPAVLWGKGGSAPAILFSRWQNGVFTPPVQISTGGVFPGIYDFGGLDLAIHGDTVYVAFERIDKGIYLARSTNQGASFEPPVPVYKSNAGPLVTLPSVAVTPQGVVLVSYLFENANETNALYHLARSTDGGQTFSQPVVASAPAAGDHVCECCPSDILCQGDSVWLAFRNLQPGNIRDIWVSASADQGASFSAAVDVDDTNWVQSVCPSSAPRMHSTGDSLVTVWMSRGTGITRVHGSAFAVSDTMAAPGFTFEFSGTNGTQNHPDIAGQADTIGVVWEESGIPGNSTEVFFTFSTQGTQGLPDQIRNLTQAPGAQKSPALAYRNGAFHLIYADVLSARVWYRKGVVTMANATTAADQLPQVSVFPNPATTTIRLDWPERINMDAFQLTNAYGRVCRQWQDVRPGQQLSVAGLPPGMYYLQYGKKYRRRTQKIVVLGR